MKIVYQQGADIERESMRIIDEELCQRGVCLPLEQEAVIKRVIHATADFDYVQTLSFTEHAAVRARAAFATGVSLITDTNMALSGLSRPALRKLGMEALCYMADPAVAAEAKERCLTRAAVSMERAAREYPGAAVAVGNAPTALLALCEQIASGFRPALVVAVPVGFVNVVESKDRILRLCREQEIPCIAALGRKGGSTVAAAICNALLYQAAGALDPVGRAAALEEKRR
ncbi:precorrin-8X methylmutase [bacterium 210917-DFI.7.65]|nr:precorrin-8X methylmutase [bacterium 210917-DFI.7.65]